MADRSKIEWTDATWNPITGCSVVSPGCRNCYAMRLAGGRMKGHPSRAGLTEPGPRGPVWTGAVRFNEPWLDQPLRWRRPRNIFVVAHGDLFHEAAPDEWIDRVFAIMALAPQHRFQVLTKRPARMRRCLSDPKRQAAIDRWIAAMVEDADCPISRQERWNLRRRQDAWRPLLNWPLPHVWLGTSAEDQARAEERIPALLETPAAVRWLSAEPLLDGLNLFCLLGGDGLGATDALNGFRKHAVHGGRVETGRLDWVVAGGESGPDARPMHPAWARSLRAQCAAAGVPFHFKQWGEWAPAFDHVPNRPGDLAWLEPDGRLVRRPADIADKDDALDWTLMARVGKAAAGRRLDGRESNGMPA